MVAVADSGLTFDLVAPLIPELEGLYRDYDESRRFLTDAGLENALEWIDRSDRAGERWYTIIRWAMEVGDRVDALLARAELEYRDNAQLVEVAARIRAVRQSRAAAPIPTGAPVVPARPRPAVLDRPARALIDRVDGIGLLESALRDVSTASGGALLLIGESGIGKTSLAERAAWLAAEMDVVVVHAQCIGPSAEPLLPIRDGLAAYRGERPVREMLAEGGPSLQPYLQFVQSLLRVE
ncbi:MAG TPA: AAA family ATPase, partial [Candidatus Limnocylindrales bacterium]